jgi:enamine deaminase RidA (YjgF/YER057c/UK114 family)
MARADGSCLRGQTGGDEKGDYQPGMAGQAGVALQRIIKLLAEAGADLGHIVRLTWYLTNCRCLQRAI